MFVLQFCPERVPADRKQTLSSTEPGPSPIKRKCSAQASRSKGASAGRTSPREREREREAPRSRSSLKVAKTPKASPWSALSWTCWAFWSHHATSLDLSHAERRRLQRRASATEAFHSSQSSALRLRKKARETSRSKEDSSGSQPLTHGLGSGLGSSPRTARETPRPKETKSDHESGCSLPTLLSISVLQK